MTYADPERRKEYKRQHYKRNAKKYQAKRREIYRWGRELFLKRLQEKFAKTLVSPPSRPCPDSCELCGRKGKRRPALDHDHVTMKFRGWLCSNCNLGIGKLGDSIEGLERALKWLKANTL